MGCRHNGLSELWAVGIMLRFLKNGPMGLWYCPLIFWMAHWNFEEGAMCPFSKNLSLSLLRTKYVPSLVKIHWRILILECSQGCYVVKIWPSDLDLWTWKSIGFQTLLRTNYVPSLVKIDWTMFILECSQGCYGKNLTPWPLTLKINRVPDSPKDYVCTKFGQNPLQDVDSRVFTRMLRSIHLTRWHWPLTYDLENK
jgi:hypothetical protein